MSNIPSKKGTIVLKGNQLVWIPAAGGGDSSKVAAATTSQQVIVKTPPVANVSQMTQKSSPIKVQLIRTADGIKLIDKKNQNPEIVKESFFAKPVKSTTRILLKGHGQMSEAEPELGGVPHPDFFIDSIDASIPLEEPEFRRTNNIHIPNIYEDNSAISSFNYSRSLPSNFTIDSPTVVKTTHQDQRANLPLVYFTAVDNVLEESIGGPAVGANSMHTMSLNELPHLNQKKNVQLKGLRKPCNCTRSMCLKLYCECFANGEFCKNCNCTNCKNVMTSENDRSRAIRSCLERNPMAFQPKIGKGRADTDRLHSKGCNCKKSSCLKNYCECYEAKVACTAKCKCVACRNTETDRLHNKLTRPSLGLFAPSVLGAFGPEAEAAAAWTTNNGQASRRLPLSLSPTSSLDRFSTTSDDQVEEKSEFKKLPWFYLNDDVVQATTLCMVAQADQLENQMSVSREIDHQEPKLDDLAIQRAVLREFGACLQQIIQSSI